MDLPPSYDQNDQALSPNDRKDNPPDYLPSPSPTSLISSLTNDQDPSSSSWHPLPHDPHPTLILDNCTIYSSNHSSRHLYILSNAPVEATAPSFALEKVYYKFRPSDNGEGREEVKRSRTTYIYDFALEVGASSTKPVSIKGQRSSKFTYREVTLSGPRISASHYKATFKVPDTKKGSSSKAASSPPDTFDMRVTPVMADPKSKLAWKSESEGALLATETRGTRDVSGKMFVQPRLEVVAEGENGAGLEEKEMDLLVAAWCARVWREAAKDTKEPMSWNKCESHSSPLRVLCSTNVWRRLVSDLGCSQENRWDKGWKV